MPNLNNKVALITGAASGIGRASAIRMAADGASVMCSDLNEEAAVNTARVIEQEGGRATAMALDVTDGDAVESAIETTASRLGACQVIFNNAGVGGGPEIGWDMTIGVNLSGVYYGHASWCRFSSGKWWRSNHKYGIGSRATGACASATDGHSFNG